MLALLLVAALSTRAAGQEKGASDKPPPDKDAGPMASFARLTAGEWRQTANSGKSMYHTWHWGPGRHSIRRTTEGSGAGGQPWRELQVFYWHPGRKQVRLLGVSPHARGVSEGAIRFQGETADGVMDLDQTRGRRRMGLRWAFNGPDKYRETLLEATGPDGLKPLVELDHVRSQKPWPRPPAVEDAPEPSILPKALASLLGHTWEAKGETVAGAAVRTRSSVEWVPYADAIYARVVAPANGGETTHQFDAYVYHHTGAKAMRCLALSDRSGVYEGDVTEVAGGGLQLDLKGYEGDRVVSRVVQLDFEVDGTLRQRTWSLTGTERTLVLDVRHKKVEPKK